MEDGVSGEEDDVISAVKGGNEEDNYEEWGSRWNLRGAELS